MHTPQLTPLYFALLATVSVSSFAEEKPNISVHYLAVNNAQEQRIKEKIIASGINTTVIELSDDLFPFSNTLTIEYGGDEGPLYDPQSHRIHIPYAFYQDSLTYFSKNKYQERFNKSPELGALDTLLHTLLHEAGHALIADQHIPILGKEEDAVDNFATVLLLNYVNNGDDAAISAADMFAFESNDRPDYYDFGEYIGEHSFDLQRYFSTLCLVYGSNPKKYDYLLDEVENDYLSERKDVCVFQFSATTESWMHYLTTKAP